jgi:hypothetical protein
MRLESSDAYLRAAASDLLTLGLDAFARWMRQHIDDRDDDEIRAAELLVIEAGAGEDEIRAALRSRITRDKLHPDQGGDGIRASELIAAQNLLLARARLRRPAP